MYSNFANISFLIDNMANPLNLSCEVIGKRISLGVRQKEPLMLIDYQEMLLERESICGLMMTSCKNDFLKERETFGGKT